MAAIVAGGALVAYGCKALGPVLAAQSLASMAPGASSFIAGNAAAATLLKVGGVGVAAMGIAFLVPVGILVAAGVVLFGATGYTLGPTRKVQVFILAQGAILGLTRLNFLSVCASALT